jgi:hypothetical protein
MSLRLIFNIKRDEQMARKARWIIAITLLYLSLSTLGAAQSDSEPTKAPELFLGQRPLGMTAVPFAPDILTSTYHPHGSLTFAADNSQLFWEVFLEGHSGQMILYSDFNGTRLSDPQNAPFAQVNDCGPCFSWDGEKIFFSSGRALPDDQGTPPLRIWTVERNNSGWREPQPLIINLLNDYISLQVSVSRRGNLLLSFYRQGDPITLSWSDLVNGSYSAPTPLRGEITSNFMNSDPFVDPEEAYLLFASPDRPDGYGIVDLYISFKQRDGSWGEPINLGNEVNTEYFERFPSVSRDGKYLFFIRCNDVEFPSEDMSFYWVSARILKQANPSDLAITNTKIKPKKLSAGTSVNLSARIGNKGGVISITTEAKFYLSPDKKLGKKSILLGEVRVTPLFASQYQTVKLQTNIPENIKSGEYYLIVKTDEGDLNCDPDKSNNTSCSKKKLLIK